MDKKGGTDDRISQLQVLEEKLSNIKLSIDRIKKYFKDPKQETKDSQPDEKLTKLDKPEIEFNSKDCNHKWRSACSLCLAKRSDGLVTTTSTSQSTATSPTKEAKSPTKTSFTDIHLNKHCLYDTTTCQYCGIPKLDGLDAKALSSRSRLEPVIETKNERSKNHLTTAPRYVRSHRMELWRPLFVPSSPPTQTSTPPFPTGGDV